MSAQNWWRCALALASLAVVPSLPAEGPQWLEIRSPHFSVVTDAGEKRGREAAMRFEQMRSVFATMYPKAKVNNPIPLQIVAFRNTKEFRQFAPLWQGKPTELTGLFQPGQDRSFILLDMSVENPWSVVFHEYAHQLMNGMVVEETEPWFQEGFAEFFASIEVDNKQAKVGKIPEYTYQVLHQTGLLRISDLFSIQHQSAAYNESGDRRTAFYAESTLVVHYMYDNQLIPKLGAYFTLRTYKRLSVEDAIQQAFGMSSAQFDKILRDYVRGESYKYYVLATPPDIVKGGYDMASLSATQAGAILADVHLHSPDYKDKAMQEFKEILKTDPDNATAWRGLGYAYLDRKEFSEAAEHFRRAAQLDPKDARVHFYTALLLQGQGFFVDRSRLPEIIKELETAVSLDQDFAPAYALLGMAQSSNGDATQGIASMRKAIALEPHNESNIYNLAIIYMQNRQPDPAIELFTLLTRSQNRQVAFQAGQSLMLAQRMKDALGSNHAIQVRIAPDEDSGLEPPDSSKPPGSPAPAIPAGRVQFMKGLLTAVDCSAPPAAVLTVTAGGTTWKLTVADTHRVVVLGADAFSCSWSKQKVALNYVQTAPSEGRIVSVEIQ